MEDNSENPETLPVIQQDGYDEDEIRNIMPALIRRFPTIRNLQNTKLPEIFGLISMNCLDAMSIMGLMPGMESLMTKLKERMNWLVALVYCTGRNYREIVRSLELMESVTAKRKWLLEDISSTELGLFLILASDMLFCTRPLLALSKIEDQFDTISILKERLLMYRDDLVVDVSKNLCQINAEAFNSTMPRLIACAATLETEVYKECFERYYEQNRHEISTQLKSDIEIFKDMVLMKARDLAAEAELASFSPSGMASLLTSIPKSDLIDVLSLIPKQNLVPFITSLMANLTEDTLIYLALPGDSNDTFASMVSAEAARSQEDVAVESDEEDFIDVIG